jgi:hypothetical protein
MKGNKYDNLFGDDRDWIEDALRDYEVPDGVINEIGAHFIVLQTKLDKLEAEKVNKRDIFAEIAADYDGDDDFRRYFKKIADEDVFSHLTPKNATPTVSEIMDLWPAGTEVKYNTFIEATRLKVAVTVTHDGALAFFKYDWKTAEPYSSNGRDNLIDWLGNLGHAQLVALKKKLKKNIQRTVDIAKARKPVKIIKREPHIQSLKTGKFFSLTPNTIADLWPIGMSVKYTHKRTQTERNFLRTGHDTLRVTDYQLESGRNIPQGTRPLFAFLRELNREKKRKLLKRIFKNRQRKRDSIH